MGWVCGLGAMMVAPGDPVPGAGAVADPVADCGATRPCPCACAEAVGKTSASAARLAARIAGTIAGTIAGLASRRRLLETHPPIGFFSVAIAAISSRRR